MGIAINKVFNANVYLDGTNDLMGRAAEIKLPELAAKMAEHSAVGMVGTLELPTGLDKMSMTFKWAGFYPEVVKAQMNPFGAHKFQIRCNLETYDASGRAAQVPLVILVTASSKKAALGTVKAQESLNSDDEWSVTYIKVTSNGEELVEVDVYQNIWKVGGVDVLETYRANVSGG
jgi:P2 family phage contractile tail tube protein